MPLLEVGNLGGLVLLIVLIMVGPPIVLTLIGLAIRRTNPKGAKVFYILGGIYLLIGLGICGMILTS